MLLLRKFSMVGDNLLPTHRLERISLATEVLENVNPDLSDSEFIERDEPLDMSTPAVGSDMGDAPTPGDFGEGDGEDDDDDDDDEPEGDIDEDLAAELNMALEEEGEGEEEEEDEDEEDSDEEDDDDDDPDTSQARRRLNEEIRDLEAAVAKKVNEIAGSVNPLIKVHLLFDIMCCHS
jgi:transcription initiation factor TFIID subunit 7